MVKRKQNAPKQATEEKRQALAWNMMDQNDEYPGSSCSNTESGTNSSKTTNGIKISPRTPNQAICVDRFYQNLAHCQASLTIINPNVSRVKDSDKAIEFGKFKITLFTRSRLFELPSDLPEFKECWLYVSTEMNSKYENMLYFETEESRKEVVLQKKKKARQSTFGIFWFADLNVPETLLTGLKRKPFLLTCENYDKVRREMDVTIYVSQAVVIKLSHPSESVRVNQVQFAVQKLMEYYYDITPAYNFSDRERTTGHDFLQLYENVMMIHKERLASDSSWKTEVSSVGHACLKPVLRDYQKQSVAWMLRQERAIEQVNTEELHQLYCPVKLRNGASYFYNKHSGSFIREKPCRRPVIPGGILADEMGLGKTVEVLCCILLHPRETVELPELLPVIETAETRSETTMQNSETDKSTLNMPHSSTEKTEPMNQSNVLSNSSTIENSEEKTINTTVKIANKEISLLNQSNNSANEHVLIKYSNSNSSSDCPEFMNSSNSEVSDNLNLSARPKISEHSDSNETEKLVINCNENVSGHTCVEDSGISISIKRIEVNAIQESAKTNLSSTSNITNGLCENTQTTLNKPKADTAESTSTSFQDPSIEAKDAINKALEYPQNSIHANSNIQKLNKRKIDKPEQSVKHNSKMTKVLKLQNNSKGYFSSKPIAPRQVFECSCGQLEVNEASDTKHRVKCLRCGMSQHAECMNYDLTDPLRGQYLCPHCHAEYSHIKSGATLIISPFAICHQWIEEISKHIQEKSIKVFVYLGVSKQGYIQPQVLATQDIVITTYDVLRKEVDYANLPHTNSENGRRFRNPKRFLATPSPMVAVEWWRICLDEAQMVECVTTKTAEMALKLKAVNRWCVTGTPLMRNVEDIYGLLLFLGMDPFFVQQWFRLLVWEPFCHGFSAPMHHALSKVFWRTAKKDVLDQINIPEQSEEVNWLTFSPMEETFYRRQYDVYLRSTIWGKPKIQHQQNPETKLHILDRRSLNELLFPLYRLRQACCHPQIVRGEFLPITKEMLTMEKLLESMIKRVKTECEEAHRQIVASLNGKAGLAILQGKLDVAVEKYRAVLRSVDEHKSQFRTDDLQQLHAMFNLAEVLDQKPEGVAPTLRDDQLSVQCEELKEKYMAKALTNLQASQEILDTSRKNVKEALVKLETLDSDWWADVVDMSVQRGIDIELIHKVKEDLLKSSSMEGSVADSFRESKGLMFVVDRDLQVLTNSRKALLTALDDLTINKSPDLVQEAALCCLRPIAEVLSTCPFCRADELFKEYESKLFLYVERGLTMTGEEGSAMSIQVNTKRQGTWADSELEKLIKSVLAFYRTHFEIDKDVTEAANTQLKWFDLLKKEFKHLRSVWLALREKVSAVDELKMAEERLRIRQDFEPKDTSAKVLNVIERGEIAQHELKCASDEIVGREDLKKKQGQLIYLNNCAKQGENGESSSVSECPICQSGLGVEWSVMQCGHCYCLHCIRSLIDRATVYGHYADRRMKCPLCRQAHHVQEISYVTTRKSEGIQIKGSHSTKVQAVIESLIKIRQEDPTAKSLVFSVWVSVLNILERGLLDNDIPYKSLHDPNHFQKNLQTFKSCDSVKVLLLPLHVGANGLNLVEANHVLLVEPELNLEEESQAISRIYRIGQTRRTTIHRFLIRGTVEEKIYNMVQQLKKTNQDNTDGVDLTVGDITSLLRRPCPDQTDSQSSQTTPSQYSPPGSGEILNSSSHVSTGVGERNSLVSTTDATVARSCLPGNNGSLTGPSSVDLINRINTSVSFSQSELVNSESLPGPSNTLSKSCENSGKSSLSQSEHCENSTPGPSIPNSNSCENSGTSSSTQSEHYENS